jgi:hypothetical protein
VNLPPLGMTQDDRAGARILQHGGADIAGEGAGRLITAILPAQAESPLHRPGRLGHQGRWWTYQDVTARILA